MKNHPVDNTTIKITYNCLEIPKFTPVSITRSVPIDVLIGLHAFSLLPVIPKAYIFVCTCNYNSLSCYKHLKVYK